MYCVLPPVFISASQKIVLSEGRIWYNNPMYVACGSPLILSVRGSIKGIILYGTFQILLL